MKKRFFMPALLLLTFFIVLQIYPNKASASFCHTTEEALDASSWYYFETIDGNQIKRYVNIFLYNSPIDIENYYIGGEDSEGVWHGDFQTDPYVSCDKLLGYWTYKDSDVTGSFDLTLSQDKKSLIGYFNINGQTHDWILYKNE